MATTIIVIIFIGIIIAGFVYAWKFNLNKMRTITGSVKKINTYIKNEVKGRKFENIKIIDGIFKRQNNVLRETWDSYFTILKNESNNKRILDPGYYFAPQSIVNEYLNRDLSNIIPKLFTGIGIFGTFFGLVIGIWELDEINNLQSKIPVLINGMKISFTSSLTGILFSLLYSFLDKNYIDETKKQINSLSENLRKVLPVRIESNILDEIVENQELQIKANNEFISDTLIPEIVNGLQKAVDKSISPKIDQMNDTVNKMVNASTDKQTESIDKMVNKFMKNFNQTFDNQFTELQETLKEIIEWQKNNKREMDEVIQSIEKGAKHQKELTNSTSILLGNIQNYVDDFSELHRNLHNSVNTLNELGEQLTELEESTNEKLKIQLKQQEKFEEFRSDYIKQVDKQLKDIHSFWKSIEDNFQNLNNNLEGAMEQFADNTYQGLDRTFESFDDNLSKIASRLAVTIGEINEMVEEIPSSFNQLKELLNEFQVDREEIVKRFDQQKNELKAQFENHNKKLGKNINNTKEEINKELEEKLNTAKNEIVDNIKDKTQNKGEGKNKGGMFSSIFRKDNS